MTNYQVLVLPPDPENLFTWSRYCCLNGPKVETLSNATHQDKHLLNSASAYMLIQEH
jgi:hypothetical protein